MEVIEIDRCYHEDRTTGDVYYCGQLIGYSLELPLNNNIKEKSCIPEGQYICTYEFNKKGHTYRLYVTGRSGIMIHKGNLVSDTKGCILFGLDTASYGEIHSVIKSKKGMEYLKNKFPHQFKLVIKSNQLHVKVNFI